MPYLDDARRSYFRHWPASPARASVVLLHGFGEHTGHYHRLAFALNGQGLDVWGLVLTGTPLSGLPEQVADDAVMSEDPFYLDALDTDPLGFDTVPAEAPLWQAIGACVAELRDGLSGVDIPVLLVNGDRDAFAPVAEARAWASRMPEATAVAVPGFHDIVNDVAHEQVAREISSFVIRRAAVPAALRPTK